MMDIFDSPWLINMLAKSSQTPQGRLLGLFDVLNDWLQAPYFEKINIITGTHNTLLVTYCTEQAKFLRANNPELLAEHIVLIAQNATLQALAQPGSNSLIHAKKVANALIQAQAQKAGISTNIKRPRSTHYAIAASLSAVIGAVTISAPTLIPGKTTQAQIAQQAQPIDDTSVYFAANQNHALTAIDASRMYAKYEQMRQGTCQFPEALQIPDKHKSIYLENVVGGKLPTDVADLKVANFYLEKVRCNFTPMLMASSK